MNTYTQRMIVDGQIRERLAAAEQARLARRVRVARDGNVRRRSTLWTRLAIRVAALVPGFRGGAGRLAGA